LRNIVYRFDDLAGFGTALHSGDQELLLPQGEKVNDGEWVLAIFEIGAQRGRATAAAARGLDRGGEFVLAFERRDWERLVEFSEAEKNSYSMRTARQVEVPFEDSGAIPIDVFPPSEDPSRSGVQVQPPSLRQPPSVPYSVPAPSSAPASTDKTRSFKTTGAFAGTSNARVLLVDDDRDIREVVGAMLDAVGLSVETATSAEEALERIRQERYDMLVLDWNLPGMTGIELCRVIRREQALMGLPVLFLTAHASSKDIVEAFASGADDYVVKPFRAPELGARIFGLLRRVRMVQPSP
jgi:two-component system phosphate regulon response regulator PhoB